jgi:hypothetical protein
MQALIFEGKKLPFDHLALKNSSIAGLESEPLRHFSPQFRQEVASEKAIMHIWLIL